ncbi:MAG TPA: SAM-dependent methyltransferase [Rhodobacteraceae bacterium]|nr:SAM-dependent methyltransferase [Paracoccaceae bacterium]
MWTVLLERMLHHIVRKGTIRVTMPDGSRKVYGQGTPELGVTLKDPDVARKLILNPTLAAGEAYMDGTLEIENDDLRGFFALFVPNINAAGAAWFQKPLVWLRRSLRPLRQFAPVGKAQANVAHHYDLAHELYDLFLDADRQYSCGYWAEEVETLEQAQIAKKRHIAAKLRLAPGQRVLDIGCGWGGLALTLARDYGVHVVGVTLSKEQYAVAVERVREEGLESRVDIRFIDYREVPETFDRIVSVGMFEHVGVPQYNEFFGFVRDHLTEDGLALIHTIGHTGPPNDGDPWLDRYIFPGGYSPTLGEIMKAVDRHSLVPGDIEALRVHYAKTLAAWYDRFMAQADKVCALYDDRFVRMWRYYLLAAESTFLKGGRCLVYQLQLAKHVEAVPITRDYLYRGESDAGATEGAHPVTDAVQQRAAE